MTVTTDNTTTVKVKLDPPSNWTVVLQLSRSTGQLTVALLWGDKEDFTQYTELSTADTAILLNALDH